LHLQSINRFHVRLAHYFKALPNSEEKLVQRTCAFARHQPWIALDFCAPQGGELGPNNPEDAPADSVRVAVELKPYVTVSSNTPPLTAS
jgi:hypothetical protein